MDLASIEARARKAISPVTPAHVEDAFWGERSDEGRGLPPYYLVYYLLVKLLKFPDLGREEKVSFSIPVRFDQTVVMVQYRKFGLGLFIRSAADAAAAAEVAKRIQAAARAAEPYFDMLANAAAEGSNLNVANNASELFDRFDYFARLYSDKSAAAEARAGKRIRTEIPTSEGRGQAFAISYPASELRQEARWCATAAIEAFFSWTEHVFILIAVLQGKIQTGEDVANTAGAEWRSKFKLALDISDPNTKEFYDRLNALRTQVRNFVAHGAFGKDGQALSFHSEVGAIPLQLPHRKGMEQFKFGNGVNFLPPEAMHLIHDFIEHLWSGDLAPAKIYIESRLPLILSYATGGQYAAAMMDEEEMTRLTDHLHYMFDQAADMDW